MFSITEIKSKYHIELSVSSFEINNPCGKGIMFERVSMLLCVFVYVCLAVNTLREVDTCTPHFFAFD